jgi:hypothetical protein
MADSPSSGLRPPATRGTTPAGELFRRNYSRVRMPTGSRRVSASEPSARRTPDSSTRRGPRGSGGRREDFSAPDKAHQCNFTRGVPTVVLGPQLAQFTKKYVDKLWVSPRLSRPILFVKEPAFATERSNSPGDRVATGCKLVASWAKLVIGREGHRSTRLTALPSLTGTNVQRRWRYEEERLALNECQHIHNRHRAVLTRARGLA